MYLMINSEELPVFLPGYLQQYGVKTENPKHYQGDKLIINFPLPDANTYVLRAYLVASLDSNEVIWAGTINNGIEIVQNSININIKSAPEIPSGVYYLSVIGSKINNIEGWETLINETITITPSAASPYPTTQDMRNQTVALAPTRQPSVILMPMTAPKESFAWYEGDSDTPLTDPTDKTIPAIYSGKNGTFFRWSVDHQKWISIVS